MQRIPWATFVLVFLFPVLASAQWPALDSAPAIEKSGPNDVAVIVAVEDYLLLPDVQGAVQNANDWETFLRNGRGLTDVTVLVNQDATREAMLKFAKKAAAAAKAESTVWWVFIGHGAPTVKGDDGLLVGMDAQQSVESLEARGLPQKELLAALESGPQQNTVVLVDACFSGRSNSGSALAAGVQPVVPVKMKPTLKQTTVIMSAAKSTEVAGQLPGEKRPAFSYLVLGGLRGWADDGDGNVTAGEALLYAQRELRSVKGRQQTPGMMGESQLVLARNVTEKKPKVVAKSSSEEVCPTGMMRTADTAGNCCWVGQAWSQTQNRCVGQPAACPPGTTATASACVAGSSAPTETAPAQREPVQPPTDWSNDPRVSEYLSKRVSHPEYKMIVERDGKEYKGSEKYEVIGRPDLAEKYKSWSPALLITGVVFTGVGAIGLGIAGFEIGSEQPTGKLVAGVTGAVLGISGPLVMLMSPLVRTEPVDYDEFTKLVNSHNRKLVESLGLPADIDDRVDGMNVSFGPLHASDPFAAAVPSTRGVTLFQLRF